MPSYPSSASSLRAWRPALVLTAALAVLVVSSGSALAQTPRIQASPSDTSLAEGGSIVVELRLAEPVISATGPGVVTVALSVSDERLELFAPSVGWSAADWFQPRTVQVSAAAGSSLASQPVVITGLATSDSEFYDQYSFVVQVTVAGGAPGPVPTSTTSTTAASTPADAAGPGSDAPGAAPASPPARVADELAITGASGELALVGVVLVLVGVAVLGHARRRHPVA